MGQLILNHLLVVSDCCVVAIIHHLLLILIWFPIVSAVAMISALVVPLVTLVGSLVVVVGVAFRNSILLIHAIDDCLKIGVVMIRG